MITFGIGYSPTQPAPRVIEAAQLAERLGYDVFWITDSHMAAREAMVMLGAIAVSTSTIGLGTGVTHLAGRHPTVIAGAMATLDDLAPGRVRIGIGVGDSGPLNLGVPRATLRDLEAAVVLMRELIAGHEVDGGPRPLRIGYTPVGHPIPIYVAASSERSLRLAGRVADGALVSGVPDELPANIRLVREGEQAAGRPPGSTRILLWTTAAVADDAEVARATVRGSVARRALNTLGRLARDGRLGPEDAADLERLQRATAHEYRLEAVTPELVPERWIDRFAIAGTPAQVRARLEQGVRDGADEIGVILLSPGSSARGAPDQLARFAEGVITPLKRAVAH